MKLTTVKGKVLAGVAAVTLVSGAGFVAANTDAGANLQSWYNKAFGINVAQVEVEVVPYGANKLEDLSNHISSEKEDGKYLINESKIQQKNEKTDNIKAAKQSHIDAINKKEDEISAYMEKQFDDLSKANIKTFNTLSTGISIWEGALMASDVNNTGKQALRNLEKELLAEKEAAKTELAERIADAKLALNDQLAKEKGATVAEIKAAIDAKTEELKGAISTTKDILVTRYENKLKEKAAEIEGKAKSEMDDIVAGI